MHGTSFVRTTFLAVITAFSLTSLASPTAVAREAREFHNTIWREMQETKGPDKTAANAPKAVDTEAKNVEKRPKSFRIDDIGRWQLVWENGRIEGTRFELIDNGKRLRLEPHGVPVDIRGNRLIILAKSYQRDPHQEASNPSE